MEEQSMMSVITEEMLSKYPDDITEVTEFRTKVVGTTFRKREHLDLVDDGDFVLIVPEVGNPHDSCACRVIHNNSGNHIGYIAQINSIGEHLSETVWNNIVHQGDMYLGQVTVTGRDKENIGINLLVKRLHVLQERVLVNAAG